MYPTKHHTIEYNILVYNNNLKYILTDRDKYLQL